MDLAFPEEKLDIEIDGKQHLKSNGEQRLRDLQRDSYLRSEGWVVYRIPASHANVPDMVEIHTARIVELLAEMSRTSGRL